MARRKLPINTGDHEYDTMLRRLNAERAERAAAALQTYIDLTHTDLEDALTDLLGDLMHLVEQDDAEVYGKDFHAHLVRARGHFQEEHQEE
jgi:hypothetical protein